VVLQLRPLNITIPSNQAAVTKTLRVTVRNADILPIAERPGHTIQLVANEGTCPPGTLAGLPDFDSRTAGSQDSVLLAGNRSRRASVPLIISRDAFVSIGPRAPHRCTLTFTAQTIDPVLTSDPVPANNQITLELTVTDLNDPAPPAREIYVASMTPVKVVIAAGKFTVLKTVFPSVGSATVPHVFNDPITVTTSDGTCPAGTVDAVDFDFAKPGAQNLANVAPGSTRSGSLVLTINGAAFTTSNSISPTRCTALLTVTSPFGDSDATNNTTRLVIDVTDKNDF
jgi:hypothetical protein